MKVACSIVLTLIINSSAISQQFYLRGEVKDEAGNAIQNVTILQPRTGYVFKSGTTGSFGITTTQQLDTFSFSRDGYQAERILVNAETYLSVRLKLAASSGTSVRQNKLLSLTKGIPREENRKWFVGDETYASIIENHFVDTRKYPNTGLSLNVDRASYSNIRRFITQSSQVPPDAVRIEEMLNYFNLNYCPPPAKDLFSIQTKLTSCPWSTEHQLYYVNLSAKKLNLDNLPPSHLVFLIDVSGSMDMANRLPLLKSSFRMLVNNLRDKDSVSIVVYGGITGIMLNCTSGGEKEKILTAIDELTPGGSTPGESGIKLAYSVAKKHFIKGGNNRVILATDGDFNVGLRSEQDLDEMISLHRESGIYLTCLGVGMGNYKDSKIQTLARKGNGNFAYLDTYREAEKVLMKEFTQTLYAVADDAYMNIEFNPQYVKEYRLLGFDNKVGALNDSLAVVEGGEIGSGYSMMGLFEILPVNSDMSVIERFSEIKLRYRLPRDSNTQVYSYHGRYDYDTFEDMDSSYKFSAAVALFGSLLRTSNFTKTSTWNDLVTLSSETASPLDPLQQEFIGLVQQAKVIYAKGKKKKKGEER